MRGFLILSINKILIHGNGFSYTIRTTSSINTHQQQILNMAGFYFRPFIRKMFMKVWISTLFMLLSSYCQGQFNDSLTHHLRLSASGNINRTANNIAYLLSNDARFSIRNKTTVLNTAASWVYGKQNAALTNNDFAITADVNRYASTNFYYWGLANFTTSLSLRLNRQLQTGIGVAYNFVNNQQAWLNVSNGLLYETSSLLRNDADERYNTIRNSFRLSYRFTINGAVMLNGVNYWQPSFRNGNDFILRTNNSIGYKLNRWLALTASLAYNQVRRTRAENLLFTYGLTAENFY